MSTLHVYLSPYTRFTAADLHGLDAQVLAETVQLTHCKMPSDYTLVGTAEVQITLQPRADVMAQQVAALRQQIEDTRLEAGVKVLKLEQQINSLLCIEGAASEVAA